MRRERIPVIVLAGGLGSGKTTLLNHLLRHAVGRLGVIVNDFGDINVDAFLVTGRVDAQANITGGCLCCIADTSELDDALNALAAPSVGLDAIVIEASGLAEPRTLARMVLASPVPDVRFGGVIELVDAAAWLAAREGRAPMPTADHLQVASLVVMTKTDLVAPADLEAVEAWVRDLAPHTPLLRAAHGQVDPALLLDISGPSDPSPDTGQQLSLVDVYAEQERADHDACGHGCHHDHTDGWSSVSIDAAEPVDPRALMAFLEQRSASIYRIKGETFVDADGARDRWVVQAVGGWVSFERGPWQGRERGTRLVAIGTDIDAPALEARMREVLSNGTAPTAQDVHAMGRYARRAVQDEKWDAESTTVHDNWLMPVVDDEEAHDWDDERED